MRRVAPLAEPGQASREARLVGEYAALRERGEDWPLELHGEVGQALERLRVPGAVLEGIELARILGLLEVTGRAARALRAADPGPELAALAARVPDLGELEAELRRSLDEEGRLLDGASANLASIRSRRRVVSQRIDRAVEQFFAAQRQLVERIATLREDRTVVAVRSDLGPSRLGLVHGRSSTGATCYVEPFALVELNNESIELRDEEGRESERIRRHLSARLAGHHGELLARGRFAAELDFTRARARLMGELGGAMVEPAPDGAFDLEGARHPLLVLELGLDRVVPMDLRLAQGDTLVITGPNTGGKSVALKTLGLTALAYACGLPVSARRARLPLLRSLFVDIGDPQSIQQNLSTFSGHLERVARAVGGIEPPSLVLLDELGSGTDPREGSALGVAIVEHLRREGASTVVTSHHEALKRYALGTRGVRAATVEFDERSLAPTYRLLLDRTGRSNALIIAERLGIPAPIVAEARARMASERSDVEELLGRLDEAARAHDAARAALQAGLAELAGERQRLLEREAAMGQRDAEIRERERRLRGELKAQLRARLESLLAELRSRGQEILARLSLPPAQARRQGERLERELRRARAEALRADAAEEQVPGEPDPPGAGEEAAPGVLRAGGRVRVRGLEVVGELLRLEGDRAEVDVKGKRLQVSASALLVLGGPGAAAGGGASPAVAWQLRPRDDAPRELNLVGLRVEEALERVDKFLDDAVLARLPAVRLIHGHGTGRLRERVREHLKGHPQVCAIESETRDGVTRVDLE